MRGTRHSCMICYMVLISLFAFRLLDGKHTITSGEVFKDWEILESQNKLFQLGFFTPIFSGNRYLAIRSIDYFENKMVWVANRDNPLNDTSGYLNITGNGYLVISDARGVLITLNPDNPSTQSNTSLELLDSGNLVLKSSGQSVIWQSFDHPTDTILPGMKVGLFDLNLKRPRRQILKSWLSPGVPAAGAFTLGFDPSNTEQLQIWRRGVPYWRGAARNERDILGHFTFEEESKGMKFSYVSNENETYFFYTLTDSILSWIELNSTGDVRLLLREISGSGLLGPVISCGSQKEYRTEGCLEQKKPSKCGGGDEFVLVLGSMESWEYSGNSNTSLADCEVECRNNCSCTAYASALPDGSGCMFSYGLRFDITPIESAQSFHIRNGTESIDSREIAPTQGPDDMGTTASPPISLHVKKEPSSKNRRWVIIVASLLSLCLALSLWYLIRKNCFFREERRYGRAQVGRDTQQFIHELGTTIAAMDEVTSQNLMLQRSKDHELPLFSFSTIETATENFSEANKLGQGGFGPVYKGILVDGQEIAVKRLSERSGQGAEEFKNEVVLISKVQHRNLVRLFGCCIKGDEKLLIYEYLSNKSLDTFIYDETKRALLDWRMRMNIIEGIAQGLLYLHKFSRLKIIHRDLKTSNILLDSNMNPKISDFGTAKIFGENESRANTNRIVGTYGYMSPEYAMDGLFSVKSDVFSFGVIILEIVTGKKNTGFYQTNNSVNLIRHAWNMWKEEKSLELMDPKLAETCSASELERCVQTALLCVQENASDRPTMSDVMSMLGSERNILPEPKQSSFSALSRQNGNDLPDNMSSNSVNGLTLSSTLAR